MIMNRELFLVNPSFSKITNKYAKLQFFRIFLIEKEIFLSVLSKKRSDLNNN